MADDKPIIIVKKKGGHGGHHGGAWKVAYADFVTAMMAFFMVMWLVNSADTVTKQTIATYFKRPGLFQEGSGSPLMIGQAGILEDAYVPSKKLRKGKFKITDTITHGVAGGVDIKPEEENKPEDKPVQAFGKRLPQSTGQDGLGQGENSAGIQLQRSEMEQLAKEVSTLVASNPELEAIIGKVNIKLDADGLNIEIVDSPNSSMFALGSAKFLPEAQAAFVKIGELLNRVDNNIDIVGHTDSQAFSQVPGGYSNWELSADRANAARRALEAAGVDSKRIERVVGAADRELRVPDKPLDPGNRRISIKLRFDYKRKIPKERVQPAVSEGLQHSENVNHSKTSSKGKLLAETPPDLTLSPQDQLGPLVTIENKPSAAEEKAREKRLGELSAADQQDERPDRWRPKVLIEAAEQKAKTQLVLPERPPIISNPGYVQKDAIFGDNPVFGPAEPFSLPP
ncbi:MAG: OmpA family protein [Bdellovibrionales bacterium]|nr:OmpA family protein [Bdellovibrionales bacterium]